MIKLNIDGCSKGNLDKLGAGGLFRDSQGIWRGGFVVNLGISTNTMAELWAFLLGLRCALKASYRQMLVHTDSQAMSNMISRKEGNRRNGYMI